MGNNKIVYRMLKNKVNHLSNAMKLAILTIIMIILATSGIIVIGLEGKDNDISIYSFSKGVNNSPNNNLSDGEVQVLEMVSANRMVVADNAKEVNQLQSLYVHVLTNYLSRDNIDLSSTKVNAIKKLLKNYSTTMIKKGKEDEHLSLITKGIILSVSRQIYKQCGLKLYCNIQGDIQLVKDVRGNVLYKISGHTHQNEMEWGGFICIFIICSVLIGVGFIISKKQRLFKKGGFYHGYKEKEFA